MEDVGATRRRARIIVKRGSDDDSVSAHRDREAKLIPGCSVVRGNLGLEETGRIGK